MRQQRVFDDLLADFDDFDDADKGGERAGFDHARKQIDGAGQYAADALRQLDVAGIPARGSSRVPGLIRPGVFNRFQCAADQIAHFGDTPHGKYPDTDPKSVDVDACPDG